MKNTKAIMVTINSLTLVAMLFANFVAGAGAFSTPSVAEISYRYDTLFTPAGYAFSIWSVIFLLAIGFVLYQWYLLRRGDPTNYIQKTGYWFALSNIANILWLYCWTHEMLGASVLIMLVLLFSLCVLVVRLRLELDDVPVRNILFVWWPIAIYLGWIMVATIANVAAWIISMSITRLLFSNEMWVIIMIIVASAIYTMLVIIRSLRESAIVGIWAFVAIAIRQWQAHNNISVAAIIAAVVLLVVISIHAHKNFRYNPIMKLKKGEW